MQTHCRDCQVLIESELISDPHYSLKPLLLKPEAQIYQCGDCDSCFIFTKQDISLVILKDQAKKPGTDESARILKTA